MSYLKSKHRSRTGKPQSLGLTWNELRQGVERGIDKATPTIAAALSATQDPYFDELVCQILRLQKIGQGLPPGPKCPRPKKPVDTTKGIGLDAAIVPIRGFVFARESPWVLPIAIGALVGLPFLAGYLIGRKKRA